MAMDPRTWQSLISLAGTFAPMVSNGISAVNNMPDTAGPSAANATGSAPTSTGMLTGGQAASVDPAAITTQNTSPIVAFLQGASSNPQGAQSQSNSSSGQKQGVDWAKLGPILQRYGASMGRQNGY